MLEVCTTEKRGESTYANNIMYNIASKCGLKKYLQNRLHKTIDVQYYVVDVYDKTEITDTQVLQLYIYYEALYVRKQNDKQCVYNLIHS